MDDLKQFRALNIRALAFDAVCIAIAAAVLYFANANILSKWALICGTLLALAAMVISMMYMIRARRLGKKIARERQQPAEPETTQENDNPAEQ